VACAPKGETASNTIGEEQQSAEETSLTCAYAEDGIHPQLVAHAGGAIYGYRLSNSLEALNNAYENGFRHIEVDVERTSDDEYVLIHDWGAMAKRMLFEPKVHTQSEFLDADTFMDLTPMDLDMLLAWLNSHSDCYIITDAKCGNDPFLKNLHEKAGTQSVNFIPQVYSYNEYTQAKEAGFDSVILTLYLMESLDEAEITAFAKEQQPWAITIPERFLTASLLRSLASQGVYTYTHTVNDLSYYEQWRECGLCGIYTDYFYPSKWPY
jgi:glycerophosphoryl diester phosphodiesterase